jgi:hypothetical protein
MSVAAAVVANRPIVATVRDPGEHNVLSPEPGSVA